MAYLRALSNSVKAEFEKIPNWLLRTAEAEHWNMPDPSVYGNQSDLYRKLSWVVSACDNVANVAAPTKFSVNRKVDEELKDIPNHPFENLLDQPNPLDSRSELLKATIIMRMLNGNAYWWLNRPSPFAPPEEIWYIPPHMIIPNPDEKLFIKNYLYYPGTGEELTFETHEIVHFRRFNPFSRFIGLSAIEAIALTAFGDIGMAAWNSKLFRENNGRLPGMIVFEQFVPDDTWDIIKSDMDEAARKRAFLMLRGVGQGGVQWLQNAVTQREMEFLAGRVANRDEIWNVLAPGLVSYLSENATEANSRTGESAFERLSVFPILDDFGQKITNDILPSYGGRKLVGKFDDMRKADETMELQKQQEYSKSHTVEEIRLEWYGDDPIGDDRDKLLLEQVKPESGGIQKPPPTPTFGINGNKPSGNQTGEEALDKIVGKAELDLDRFQRKALKKIGRDVEFLSDDIPESTLKFVHGQLPMCFKETAVK